MKATIRHSDSTRTDRVQLELLSIDGRYEWHAQVQGAEPYATDISGETIEDAIRLASIAWGADCWDFQLTPADNTKTSEPFYRTTLFYTQLTGLKRLTSDYEQTLVRDMLADMLHYCREYGVDFDSELSAARSHFREEQGQAAQITAIDREIKGGLCSLTGLFNDGSTRKLFSYYIDELAFADADLIGLTEDEAHQLRQQRDTEYLRS